MIKPKIVVILGQTATGKSDMAVEIAKKFNGEIISADSRQVYKGLDIGSGKITKKEMRGVKHYLLDIISPKSKKRFSVSDFQKNANKKITEIIKRGKLPIICGGTGFYIQSIVDGIVLPEVKENKELRNKLSKMSLSKLQQKLEKIDPERFSEIDQKNPIRMIRAIEIATHMKKVPKIESNPIYDCLQIGLKWPKNILEERIYKRIISRIEIGMIKEAKKLHNGGLSFKRMEELGLEYRYLALLLQNKISEKEFIENLNIKIKQYAKRQATWFDRDKRIKWFSPKQNLKIEKAVREFL